MSIATEGSIFLLNLHLCSEKLARRFYIEVDQLKQRTLAYTAILLANLLELINMQ